MFIRSTQISFSGMGKNIVSRSFKSLATCAPYKTKEIFERATQGAFRPVSNQKTSRHYLPYTGNAEELKQMSWSIYNNSIQAESKAPALIYTAADYSIVRPFKCKLVDAGRLYAPSHHIWSANATWILSQVHKMREIVSISDPIYTFGGFTRELVCAFRAGYTLASITYINGGKTITHLAPPSDEQALTLSIFNLLTISPNDCEAAQRKFNQEKTELIKRGPSKSHHDLSQFISHEPVSSSNFGLFKKNHFSKDDSLVVNEKPGVKR